MITNMYDQDNTTRIMSDHMVTNTFDKKFEMAMNMQGATKCMQEVTATTSMSNKRSDYKNQQAAASREQCQRSLN